MKPKPTFLALLALIILAIFAATAKGAEDTRHSVISPKLTKCTQATRATPEPHTTDQANAYSIAEDVPDATPEPAAPSPTPSPTPSQELTVPTPKPRAYKGIAEGDVVTGEITHYCVCKICCGKTNGITASGLRIKNGMDNPYIVSCNWLPFGAVISVNGQEYTVADRGGKGLNRVGRLDVFVPEGHKAALKKGRLREVDVGIVSLPGDN